MLEFWFNPNVTWLKKLLIFIVTALMTGTLYWIQALPLDAILMFTGTGIVFLICRYCQTHFIKSKTARLVQRICKWLPIALLFSLIFMHAQQGEILILGAQGIGFMALAIYLFSPLSYLHQNNPEQHTDA